MFHKLSLVLLSLCAFIFFSLPVDAATASYTITDLTAPGYYYLYPSAINSSGQVIGDAWAATPSGESIRHTFFYDKDGVKIITPFLGDIIYASAINDFGQFVGGSYFSGRVGSQPYVYGADGLTPIDLLTGGYMGDAIGINNNAQVTGKSYINGLWVYHAYRYDSTGLHDLGTLGGTWSYPTAINNNGWVIGQSSLPGDSLFVPFVDDGTGMRQFLPEGATGYAQAINDLNQITGYFQLPGFAGRHAFLYDSTGFHNLGTLGGSTSEPSFITPQGYVVGTSRIAGDTYQRAFIHDGSQMRELSLGGPQSYPVAVNEKGQVAGNSQVNGPGSHVFFWDGTTLRDIGTLGGYESEVRSPKSMNNLGQIVGKSLTTTTTSARQHAFLWRDGVMIDLNDLLPPNSGWELTDAYYISDTGVIVGRGLLNGQDYHHYVLTPTAPVDETPPVITVPGDLTVEATGKDGAKVEYSVSVKDETDPSPTVSCTPASGEMFPLGETTVGCTAEDANHNKSSESFRVIVQDTTRPEINDVPTITAEATSYLGAVVTFNPTATDSVGPVTVTTSPASGSTFVVGDTIVTITATDGWKNNNTKTFIVKVVDTTAPEISPLPNLILDAVSPNGVQVNFTVPVTDAADPKPVVVCSPASGSMFPIAVTEVGCIATDASGNHSEMSFTVTVKGAANQITDLIGLVGSSNLQQGISNSLETKLQNALTALNGSNPGDVQSAVNQLGAFVNAVNAQSGKKITADEASRLIAEVNRIIGVLGG